MKLLGRVIVGALLVLAGFALLSHSSISAGRVEYDGRLYHSIDEVIEVVDGAPLFCGQRRAILTLVLGFYGPYDPMVCFTSEAESDQLYAENRALEARYKPLAEKVLPILVFASLLVVLAGLFRQSGKRKRRQV